MRPNGYDAVSQKGLLTRSDLAGGPLANDNPFRAIVGKKSSNRVIRGGSWINNARNARSAYRNWNDPSNRNDNVGFRCLNSVIDVSRRTKIES
ncbi:MAG: SUMF1/EgtB/PvdO family nonheme iron enzyme [Planctomycetota bacterium]